jgi:hypothetical protein
LEEAWGISSFSGSLVKVSKASSKASSYPAGYWV